MEKLTQNSFSIDFFDHRIFFFPPHPWNLPTHMKQMNEIFLIHLLFKCAMGQVRRVQVPQLGCVAFVAGHLALRTGKDTLLTLCDWVMSVMSVLGVFFFAQY